MSGSAHSNSKTSRVRRSLPQAFNDLIPQLWRKRVDAEAAGILDLHIPRRPFVHSLCQGHQGPRHIMDRLLHGLVHRIGKGLAHKLYTAVGRLICAHSAHWLKCRYDLKFLNNQMHCKADRAACNSGAVFLVYSASPASCSGVLPCCHC